MIPPRAFVVPVAFKPIIVVALSVSEPNRNGTVRAEKESGHRWKVTIHFDGDLVSWAQALLH
jgi:hypothetical protein